MCLWTLVWVACSMWEKCWVLKYMLLYSCVCVYVYIHTYSFWSECRLKKFSHFLTCRRRNHTAVCAFMSRVPWDLRVWVWRSFNREGEFWVEFGLLIITFLQWPPVVSPVTSNPAFSRKRDQGTLLFSLENSLTKFGLVAQRIWRYSTEHEQWFLSWKREVTSSFIDCWFILLKVTLWVGKVQQESNLLIPLSVCKTRTLSVTYFKPWDLRSVCIAYFAVSKVVMPLTCFVHNTAGVENCTSLVVKVMGLSKINQP